MVFGLRMGTQEVCLPGRNWAGGALKLDLFTLLAYLGEVYSFVKSHSTL